uniref:DHRS1 n=1 Tax=Pan troglodytes TaxID=9598 RepID=A0A2I3S592_PANTR
VFPPQPDRVAIVTGGTDGIGYSTAKHLARLGMHVIIAGNNDSKAKQVVSKIKEETLNDKGTERYSNGFFLFFFPWDRSFAWFMAELQSRARWHLGEMALIFALFFWGFLAPS